MKKQTKLNEAFNGWHIMKRTAATFCQKL